MAMDRITQESNRSIWWGLRRCVTDYRSWLFVRLDILPDMSDHVC